jgi:hypothetical protein
MNTKNEIKICFDLVEKLFLYDLNKNIKRNSQITAHKKALKCKLGKKE